MDITNWKYFAISDYFEVKGSTTTAVDCLKNDYGEGRYPYVTTQAINNGVSGFYNYYTESGNVIAIESAVLGTATYQPENFSASDHVEKLMPRFSMNKFHAMFLVTVLNKENYRYCYGRKFNQGNIKNTKILLPARQDECGTFAPDWEWMENYIKSLSLSIFTPKSSNSSKNEKINSSSWKPFILDSLFSIKKGKRLTKENQTEGDTPFIGAIDSNNGVSNYIGQPAIHRGNTISLTYNGSVGEAFYQEKDFWASDDVNVLYPKFQLTRNIAMFICTILRLEKYRYTYGRKWVLEKMEKTKIMLPALKGENDKFTPNWQYMEEYINTLPYGDCI